MRLFKHSNDNPANYTCKSCHAGISRLRGVQGGIVPNGAGKTHVKYRVICLDCGTLHLVRGEDMYHRHVAMVIENQTNRRRVA